MSDPFEIFKHFNIKADDVFRSYFKSKSIKPANKTKLPDLYLDKDTPRHKQREKFRDAIKYLAQEQPDKQDVETLAAFFATIYEIKEGQDRYRHRYSDICEIIFDDLTPGDTGVPASINMLSNNIELVKQYLIKTNPEDHPQTYCIKCLDKLIDHADLESVRINYMVRQYNAAHQEIERESRQLQIAIDDAKRRYKNLKKKYSRAQRDYIAILGIFSAIVMAVVGGMAFTSGSFSAIAQAPLYNIVAIACVVGAVLIDIVYVVSRFIRDMTSFDDCDRAIPLSTDTLFGINVILLIFSAMFTILPRITLLNG